MRLFGVPYPVAELGQRDANLDVLKDRKRVVRNISQYLTPKTHPAATKAAGATQPLAPERTHIVICRECNPHKASSPRRIAISHAAAGLDHRCATLESCRERTQEIG
jgi:hypothetical protein